MYFIKIFILQDYLKKIHTGLLYNETSAINLTEKRPLTELNGKKRNFVANPNISDEGHIVAVVSR